MDFECSLGEGSDSIRSEFGEILFTISADSALNVDPKTNFGSIKSEIPITATLTDTTNGTKQIGKMNDGGSQLTVETGSGSIYIRALTDNRGGDNSR